ncbi:hypothetical protein P8452_14478 [Trifolium repens]|nr:hypothetical protein P8452_14478 [Trifolium repens]
MNLTAVFIVATPFLHKYNLCFPSSLFNQTTSSTNYVSTTIICSTMIEGEQYSMALGSVLVGVIRSDEFFNCIAI